jgi:hypothetical protein
MSQIHELFAEVIFSQELHMAMGPILNCWRAMNV